ncbi:hypothetical protein [Myxococcus phage Mx1]|nr:hypothetical protein [Myxococcus phage Mx1]
MTIVTGSRIKVVKGSTYHKLKKGSTGTVEEVKPMGAEYSHMVRLCINFEGRRLILWARFESRLKETQVRLHGGDPTRNIVIALA